MTDQEKIAVTQAQIDGRAVEARSLEIRPRWKHYPTWSVRQPEGPWNFNFGVYEYRIRPAIKQIKLNSDYSAEVGPEVTTVGCQTFPNSKILEVAEAIKDARTGRPRGEPIQLQRRIPQRRRDERMRGDATLRHRRTGSTEPVTTREW